jgi:hypothetical protein
MLIYHTAQLNCFTQLRALLVLPDRGNFVRLFILLLYAYNCMLTLRSNTGKH